MQVRATPRAAARLRGAAVGAVSATLAMAAHATGGGMLPATSSLLLLVALSAALGGVASLAPTRRSALLALLAAGQLLGHVVLGLSAMAMHPTTAPMLLAHTAAVGVAAVLVELAQRTAGTCAAAVARWWPALPAPLVVRPLRAPRPTTPPRRSARDALLTVSLPRRGPPVRA